MIQEVFNSFKSSHQPKTMTFQDMNWEYYASGRGTQTILLLPGILSTSEVLFPYFTHFESKYRVIMPIYPNVYTMKELLKGLSVILRKEQAENVILVGSGFGGAVAQCFMRSHPKLISHLILLHSNNIGNSIPKEMFHNRILYLAHIIKFTDLMPLFFTRSCYKKDFKTITKLLTRDNQFWKDYLYQLASTYTKSHMSASLGRLFDFTSNYKLSASDYPNWQGHTLLIQDTHTFGYLGIERDSLRWVYPNAHTHVEHGCGSVNILDKYDVYIDAIESFIATSYGLDDIAW